MRTLPLYLLHRSHLPPPANFYRRAPQAGGSDDDSAGGSADGASLETDPAETSAWAATGEAALASASDILTDPSAASSFEAENPWYSSYADVASMVAATPSLLSDPAVSAAIYSALGQPAAAVGADGAPTSVATTTAAADETTGASGAKSSGPAKESDPPEDPESSSESGRKSTSTATATTTKAKSTDASDAIKSPSDTSDSFNSTATNTASDAPGAAAPRISFKFGLMAIVTVGAGYFAML